MRKPVQQAKKRGQFKAKIATITAPIGGWNARDAITVMGSKDAVTLENWIVDAGRVRVRPGSIKWTTGLGSYVESLMEYFPGNGAGKLFAATPTAIYDVTSGGAVGAAVQTSLSNGRWQSVNFANSAGTFVYMVNGADAPRYFDGSSWTTPTITGSGLTASNLITVNVHMNRLWFSEKSKLKVWYLGVSAISGSATLFDLSGLCQLGGEIATMATWTRDGGDGSDDYGVFITTKGEVLVYAGVDPTANTTWALVGRYRIPPPIGRRCAYKLGAELIVLTVQGPIPLSRVMGLPVSSETNLSITDKIAGAFTSAVASSGSYFGWQVFEHPAGNLLMVNVPIIERSSQQQFVFNTRTGAWSKFTGLPAGCWSLLGNQPYFGDNSGNVWKFDAGLYGDNGQPTIATYQHAFINFGSPAQKLFGLAKPNLIGPTSYVPAVQIKTDYDTSPISIATIPALDTNPAWDATDWDTAFWGSDSVANEGWQSVSGSGSTASVAYRVAATTDVEINTTLLAYEQGSML